MNERIHRIYLSMVKRCTTDAPRYRKYFGCGIRVCDEWMGDYQKFEDWSLSNGYADGLCIDRMDTRKGYSPENCRWTTLKENARNRIDTVFVEYNGSPIKLCELCENYGIRYGVVYSRLKYGWGIEKALFTPVRKMKSRKHGPPIFDRRPGRPLKIALPYICAGEYAARQKSPVYCDQQKEVSK